MLAKLLRRLAAWLDRHERRAHAQNLASYIAGYRDGSAKEAKAAREDFDAQAWEKRIKWPSEPGWSSINRGESGRDCD